MKKEKYLIILGFIIMAFPLATFLISHLFVVNSNGIDIFQGDPNDFYWTLITGFGIGMFVTGIIEMIELKS